MSYIKINLDYSHRAGRKHWKQRKVKNQISKRFAENADLHKSTLKKNCTQTMRKMHTNAEQLSAELFC